MSLIVKATFLCSLLLSNLSYGQSNARALGLEDYRRTERYLKECQTLKELVLRDKFQTDCHTNYHHFNSGVAKAYNPTTRGQWVKVAAFNLWYPGSNSSPYKDLGIVAKIINKYDIVAASELIGSVGKDLEHNERVKSFLQMAPIQIRDLERRLNSGYRSDIEERLKDLKSDYETAKNLYRAPGYLLILDELRKLDPTWSLLLAPSGEAADGGNTEEFLGFYYRGLSVKPKINEHCEKFKKRKHGPSFACYPKLTKAWLGKSIREVFARRPYLGSFESGDFDFTLFTSHVVFRGATDADNMARVLTPSFGVLDYRELGVGATKSNFARLAEMKIILEIMEKIRSQSLEKDIIFLGDTNLESDNEFWPEILEGLPGAELFIKEPTTLSVPLYLSDGTETMGTANDYDHIIMDLKESNECVKENGTLSARVDNFLKGHFAELIHQKYLYRLPGVAEPNPALQSRRETLVEQMRSQLSSRLTIKRNKVVPDDSEIEETIMEFVARVFLSQIFEETYYKVYKEIVSDHLPVYFSCRR